MYKIVMRTEDKQMGKTLLKVLEKIFPDCNINCNVSDKEDRPDDQQSNSPDVKCTENRNRSIPN